MTQKAEPTIQEILNEVRYYYANTGGSPTNAIDMVERMMEDSDFYYEVKEENDIDGYGNVA